MTAARDRTRSARWRVGTRRWRRDRAKYGRRYHALTWDGAW